MVKKLNFIFTIVLHVYVNFNTIHIHLHQILHLEKMVYVLGVGVFDTFNLKLGVANTENIIKDSC